MDINFDVLQAFAWSITYCLIIIYQTDLHSVGMPPFALASNFAWETVAFAQDIFSFHGLSVIHLAWFFLDIIIIATCIVSCKSRHLKRKGLFWVVYPIELLAIILIFKLENGMLISCFVIDLTMAFEYFIYSIRKKFYKCSLSFAFCCTKLLGDLFALLFYMPNSKIVLIIGIIVLLLNCGC